MKENKLASAILNFFASILSWVAFGLGISSVTSDVWTYFMSNVNFGLWQFCINGFCAPIGLTDPALQATRSFIILMILFTFTGNIANIISHWKNKKQARQSSGTIWFISALFGIVGASVYTASLSSRLSETSYIFGFGYIAAWICVGLLFLANVFNYFSAQTMTEQCDDVA